MAKTLGSARGRLYRRIADEITYGRTTVSLIAAAVILFGDSFVPGFTQNKTWFFAAAIGLLGALDKADGIFARRAELNGVPITTKDKAKDPFHDKIVTHVLLGALVVSELTSGFIIYGLVLLANQLVTFVRDYKMTQSRKNAVGNVAAIPINKYKTGVQNVAHTIATSPLAAHPLGRILTACVYSISSIMAVYGYKKANDIHKTKS